MSKIGFWKSKQGFISHNQGLSQEQVGYLQNLKVGDRLVLFVNDIREGERGADLTLARSIVPNKEFTPEVNVNAKENNCSNEERV